MSSVAIFACLMLALLFLLVVLLPKKKRPVAVESQVPQYMMPQFQQPVPQPAPQPAMSMRQQEIREKVMALTGHYMELEETKFRKDVVDEAILLFTQGKS